MHKVLLFCSLGLPLFAAPKPVPIQKREEVSKAMLKLQAAQNVLLKAQMDLERAGREYEAMMQQVRRDAGAGPECNLTIDKEWQCPGPAKK